MLRAPGPPPHLPPLDLCTVQKAYARKEKEAAPPETSQRLILLHRAPLILYLNAHRLTLHQTFGKLAALMGFYRTNHCITSLSKILGKPLEFLAPHSTAFPTTGRPPRMSQSRTQSASPGTRPKTRSQ